MATSNPDDRPMGTSESDAASEDSRLPPEFPSVAVFDGSTRGALFEHWMPDSITTVRPTTFDAAVETVDDSVAVVLVRHEFSAEKRRRLRDTVESRASQHCRTIVTTTDRSPVADECVDEDHCLFEPFGREEFRDAVSRQLHLATYSTLLERYYECSAIVTSLDVKLDDRERESDDRYQRLNRQLTHLKTQLDTVETYLEPDDIRALMFDIVPQEYERKANERPANEGKYRPSHCHKCERDWNVNPDGSRAGYRRLSSFVWRCTDCGTVSDLSNPTNNQISAPR